jgi:hypothetical protein
MSTHEGFTSRVDQCTAAKFLFCGKRIFATHIVANACCMPSWIIGGLEHSQHMVAERADELSSRSSVSFPDERRAPVENLSPIKRRALVLCLEGDGTLHKRSGAWTSSCAASHEKRISGVTVADLNRDGLLTITVTDKRASARLTTRGTWFARTVAYDLAAARA